MAYPFRPKYFFIFIFLVFVLFLAYKLNNSPQSARLADINPARPDTLQTPIHYQKDTLLDEISNLIAGYPFQDLPLENSLDNNLMEYRINIDKDWRVVKRNKIVPITNWSKKNLRDFDNDTSALIYPFSGADFLYANTFFPDVSDFVLIGLEPVGTILQPDTLLNEELLRYLDQIRSSIYLSNNIGFFRTKSMETDFNQSELDGTLPILAFYIKRTHHSLLSVSFFNLDSTGIINETSAHEASGCKITFCDSTQQKKHDLYYLSYDLSDNNLSLHGELVYFLKSFKNQVVFLKAASYLMFLPDFKIIKDYILDNSLAVLQDDSGIPYRHFSQNTWDVRLFGSYSRTIDLFKYKFQPDLKDAYEKQETPEPIPFRIGYNVEFDETNLLYANRKKTAPDKE